MRFARSATKHCVPKQSIRYVVAHCGLRFEQSPPPDSRSRDQRLVYLGDDERGRPLEVMAVELSGELLVIHAMALRDRYRPEYEEAARWRV